MNQYILHKGAHAMVESRKCAMEWVAYLAGEPHSDQPVCVSPVLRQFCISLNDALPDEQRQRMRPYLARTIGTVGDGLDDARRWMCVDWLVRVYTPAWLDLVPALAADAEALRGLSPVLAVEDLQRATVVLSDARSQAAAARAAAWDAARAAAWAAAWDDAWDAAWAAAWVAAWAAVGDAARAAVGADARAAAWDAARAAAWDALAPTVVRLQDSVLSPGGLLDRMLPLEVVQLPVVAEWREVCGVA